MWKELWNFVTGNAASVVEKVETAVDDYFYTDEEKARDGDALEEKRNQFKQRMSLITKELTESQSNFKLEVEKLVSEREKQIHETYRSEINASKDVIIAELKQSDNYTKRARPTVIYAGLVIIFLEIFGLRIILLENFISDGADGQKIIESSTDILSAFLYMWGTVAGAYALGRTAEKRGISNTVTQLVTGNRTQDTNQAARTIEDKVKEKLSW